MIAFWRLIKMAKITTGQMFEQWELMNQKLEALDNKINGIIDGSTPANTQLTGSIVEVHKLFESTTIPPSSSVNIYLTFKGKSIGINGRWETGSSAARAEYVFNEFENDTVRYISDWATLNVGVNFISNAENKRVELTSPTIRLRITNPTTESLELRYIYITEYY